MRSLTPGIALLLVLAILLAGCGGGSSGGGAGGGGGAGDGSDGGSGGGQETEQQAGGEGEGNGGGAALESKIALGRIATVNEENRRFSVEPSTDEQGQEPIKFRLVKNDVVTLDGEEVEFSAMEREQAAQVEYVVVNDQNRARTVELLTGGETTE